MAAFQPSVSLSQSADGGTITITDTSNYASNTDGVTINNIVSRTDVITDGNGDAVATVTFTPGQLTATTTITQDYYLSNALSFVIPGPSTRTGTDNYLAANFYLNAAREVSRKLRCCSCNNLCTASVKADLCYNEALTATLFGVPSEAEDAIEAANALIASEECSCQ
jgi:hypothetical protein